MVFLIDYLNTLYFHGIRPKNQCILVEKGYIDFPDRIRSKTMYFDGISPKRILEGYQLGSVTDLLPVEPSVASGMFINFHRRSPMEHSVTTGGIIGGPPVGSKFFHR